MIRYLDNEAFFGHFVILVKVLFWEHPVYCNSVRINILHQDCQSNKMYCNTSLT